MTQAAKTGPGSATYDPGAFPAVAVAVDLVVLTIRAGRLSVLLIERGEEPFKDAWALPGGFVRPDETPAQSAEREFREETGLDLSGIHFEQIATYGDPQRDPRMRVISIAYVAMLPDLPLPEPGTDASDAAWWVIDDLLTEDGPGLAFDHTSILNDGVERVRAKLEYTSLACSFVPERFTISDLRRVYEAVWNTQLEPANFRRKVLSTPGFVVALDKTTSNGVGRPAELFRAGQATQLQPAMVRAAPSRGEDKR